MKNNVIEILRKEQRLVEFLNFSNEIVDWNKVIKNKLLTIDEILSLNPKLVSNLITQLTTFYLYELPEQFIINNIERLIIFDIAERNNYTEETLLELLRSDAFCFNCEARVKLIGNNNFSESFILKEFKPFDIQYFLMRSNKPFITERIGKILEENNIDVWEIISSRARMDYNTMVALSSYLNFKKLKNNEQLKYDKKVQNYILMMNSL